MTDLIVYAWPIALLAAALIGTVVHIARYAAHLAEGDRRRAAREAAWDRAYRADREAGDAWQ
jgi:hypothetical protein